MSYLQVKDSDGLLSILHRHDLDLAKPFEHEVFLWDSWIAGTTHIDDIDTKVQDLHVGDQLNLYRESANKVDECAVIIKTADDVKLGYLPQKHNLVFSRLMDVGKLVFGKIIAMEKRGNWHKIKIEIYLRD